MLLQRFVPILLALSLGCGGAGSFGLTSEDNNPQKLSAALARVEAPPDGPQNALGEPLAFLVARGDAKQLIAYNLASKEELWRVEADVSSKVVVGGTFVAHREGEKHLVGRDLRTGKRLWRRNLGGVDFLGGAADSRRVFFSVADKTGDKSVWILTALDGKTGDELWMAESPGALGAPSARGGLVFSPFLKQWLAILDARTGEQLTRIRGIDQAITFVRTTPDAVYFGSEQGVFHLDRRAASGKVAESTYGKAELPEEFVRVHYFWDAFDPVQAGYSAYDRNRILWRGDPEAEQLRFHQDRVVVHTYRFFFGFEAGSGKLEWAYNHPRVDVVASAHLGSAIGFASMLGNLGALDPSSGARIYEAEVKDVQGLLGATFDAEGWKPSESSGGRKPASTAAALASIARDRDARFNDVKRFAVTQLSKLEGADVTRDLLALIQNEDTPQFLYETSVEVLVSRKDPDGLPHLIKALGTGYDYIEGIRPRAVGVVAQAMAALGEAEIGDKQRARAVKALLAHLRAPETPAAELEHVVRALGAIGRGGEVPELKSFLLAYRADPAFSAQIGPLSAAINALLDGGGQAAREAVSFVAEDPRTQPAVAEYARRALDQTAAP